MPAELHLPDLPEVPISIGPAARAPDAPALVRPAMPWPMRVRDALASYLPLLLMAALALASWWLVRNAPKPLPEPVVGVPRAAPDYTMQRFVVQRFAADGALRLQLEGRELRHYAEWPGQPERIEVDQVELRAFEPDGRVMVATARRAVSNGDGTEIRLLGGAELRGTDESGRPLEIRSEFLEALLDQGIVRTDQPVQVVHAGQRMNAGGMTYTRDLRRLDFRGPVRAVLPGARR